MPKTIDQLILNSPYKEPSRYWSYQRETREFVLKESVELDAGVGRKPEERFVRDCEFEEFVVCLDHLPSAEHVTHGNG